MSDTTKPLLSYLLLTYNQENYVREAVESAFAQTYSPLEIIISDDHSTDNTWEIIKELFKKYSGPHKLRIIRNRGNLGIAQHINRLFSIAKGELIFLAAGDDIAFPERVKTTVQYWMQNPNAIAFCSNYKIINSISEVIGESNLAQTGLSYNKLYELKQESWAGCCPAFSNKLYNAFGDIKFKNSTEDRVLFRRSILLGKVFRIKEPLIYYRNCGISNCSYNLKKLYIMQNLNFYGLKNFFYDVKKIKVSTEINKCKIHIYIKSIISFLKLLLLYIFMKLNINPFNTVSYMKKLIKQTIKQFDGYKVFNKKNNI